MLERSVKIAGSVFVVYIIFVMVVLIREGFIGLTPEQVAIAAPFGIFLVVLFLVSLIAVWRRY